MFIHHWQLLIIGLKGSSLCIDFGAFALATKIIASNMSLMEAYCHSKKNWVTIQDPRCCSVKPCQLWIEMTCVQKDIVDKHFGAVLRTVACCILRSQSCFVLKVLNICVLLMSELNMTFINLLNYSFCSWLHFFPLFFCDIRGQ